MFDQSGDGWWINSYLGISWYLSDVTRTKLFYTGSLCNGTTGSCHLCLADGDYTFRVTGHKSSFISWNFCGVRGSYGEELVFEVEDNHCYPIGLLDIQNSSAQTITYVFESTVEVCLKEKNLNLTDPNAALTIKDTIMESLNTNNGDVITIEAIEEVDNDSNENGDADGDGNDVDSPGPNKQNSVSRSKKGNDNNKNRSNKNKPSRGGNKDDEENNGEGEEPIADVIYHHKINFRVSIQVHSDELHIDDVLESYEDLFASKVSDGSFISTLKSNSLIYGYLPFNWTSCAVSSEFTYYSAHYDLSLPFVASTLLFTPGSNNIATTKSIETFDYSAIVLFFGSVIVGFIALVGIISKGYETYDAVSSPYDQNDKSPNEIEFSSTHSSTSPSSHGLLSNSIEMDPTITNPLGRNAAIEAQLERVRSSL